MRQLREFFSTLWHGLRYLKPFRTFFQALAAGFGVSAVGEALPGIETVDWLTLLSIAVSAGVFSFVQAMAEGKTLWTEDYAPRPVVDTDGYIGKHEGN